MTETISEYIQRHPFWGKLEVIEENDSYRVLYTCKLFVNSPFYVGPAFSKSFTKSEMLNDDLVTSRLKEITGLRLVTEWKIP